MKRLLILVVILYFTIAAYGCYHKPAHHGEGWDYVCPCEECDCGSLDELPKHEQQEAPHAE